VDEGIEAISNGFSDHLSSGDELSIKSVKDIFKIFSFPGFFRVKELQEGLNECVSDVNLERFNIGGIIDD
jgi:hypothetical protein